MGRMDNNKAVPQQSPDRQQDAATNRQDPTRQVNAQDAINQRGGPAPEQPDHSMNDEEPLGWDQAPTDIHDPKQQRQPRTEGKGGTPFPPNTYACRPPGAHHGPFKSEHGCMLLEIHYYDPV